MCDDGLVIDLSPMRYVRVDPKKKTVQVGGGALWRDVDHATHAFGLAVPSGIISTTGVAGLTLGGYSAGGAYINFMMDEGEERIRATYGGNYKRLTKIKKRYDPGNLFRVNQNIRPR